jgi:hypothetical protein
MAYSVELVRRIYHDESGACIQVGPGCDGLGCVEVRAPYGASKAHFGNIDFTVPAQVARLLGNALLDAAADAGE